MLDDDEQDSDSNDEVVHMDRTCRKLAQALHKLCKVLVPGLHKLCKALVLELHMVCTLAVGMCRRLLRSKLGDDAKSERQPNCQNHSIQLPRRLRSKQT